MKKNTPHVAPRASAKALLATLPREVVADMSDLILKVAAAPAGKAQKAIMEYLDKGLLGPGGSKNINDMKSHSLFKGMHLKDVMSAAEALAKKGLVEFDGVTLKKK